MRKSWFLVFFICAGCATAPHKAPSIDLAKAYQLVWHDDFSGTHLNLSKWTPLVRLRDDAYDNATAIRISNGLSIRTYSDHGKNYTGFLSTRDHFQAKFGFYEARINFHDSPGEWCSFWVQSPTNGKPVDNPQKAGMEIDVSEHRSTNADGHSIADSTHMGGLHWNGYGHFERDISSQAESPSDGKSCQGHFHTYGLLWLPDGYRYYVDGHEVLSHLAPTTPVSQRPEFIYLSCEVEDKDWAGRVPVGGYGDLKRSRTGMDVAWVRVWQSKNNLARRLH